MSLKKPRIPATSPKPLDLKAGEKVAWCTCGLSQNQPRCDGSHKGTDFKPLIFKAEADDRYYFCQCKQTNTAPLCDGSHKRVTQEDIDQSRGIQSVWYRVSAADLKEGEVRAVQAGQQNLALILYQGQYSALDNACPHQGGPLGEGSVECSDDGDCWLRCPWHGWDFHPTTGKSPGSHDDGVQTFPVEVREDGIYVQVKESGEKTRTISNVMVETMVKWGVKSVFGMVGHSNLGLADAIREAEVAGGLSYFGIRHEGAAAFACSGYAKLSGRPAACLTIAGPGATNLLTGLWDAQVDRAPVLALTGQVNTQVLGPGAFQEIDLASAFAAVAPFSQTVLASSRHAELMSLALKNALVQRTVSHLIYPDEVQILAAAEDARAASPKGRLASPAIQPAAEALTDALRRLDRAKKPTIIVGYGAREAMDSIVALAERLDAPVLTTFKAKGQIPDAHPLAAGVLGRSGTPIASWFMNESDLLLVFGASFSNHTGITAKKSIIQVDFDRLALGRFHPVDVPLWGEVGVTARLLTQGLENGKREGGTRAEIAERWAIWRDEKQRRTERDQGRGLNSATIFGVLSEVCPENAVIAVDVGNNTYSFGRYFECQRQSILMSGYLGSIGFSFPAAMGAWAATQDLEEHRGRPVLSVSGDGGFGQYLADFTTAVKYGMNLTHVLLNNSELGKISKEQRLAHWPVWQTSLQNPNFSEFAENCGGRGIRVSAAEDLKGALQQALAYEGPALVEIMADVELV